MDKVREDFESYYKKQVNPDGPFDKDGIPSSYYACIYWEAWRASRAALVVKLPERVLVESSAVDEDYDLHDLDAYYEPNDIHEALYKAGIKYE